MILFIITVFTACSSAQKEIGKVLFTTPEGYAERLSDALKEQGLEPVSLPAVKTVIPVENKELESLLLSIEEYDYIAFSSRKAIEAFFIASDSLEMEEYGNVVFCAIGKDSEKLNERDFNNTVIVPAEPSPAGIVDTLEALGVSADTKIAVLVPEVRGLTEPGVVPSFIKGLENTGMEVSRVNAYVTSAVQYPSADSLRTMIRKGEYDVIAFTSTAEIEAFLLLTGGKTWPGEQVLACFGPYTAANAEDMGLEIDIIASDYSSFSGFARAIKDFYK